MCLLEMNSVYSRNHDHTTKKGAMQGPNPEPLLAKQSTFIIKNSSEENIGGGRKRTWFRSLRYENNTNALTDGQTDGLNTDAAIMQHKSNPKSHNIMALGNPHYARGRNWAGGEGKPTA